MTTIQPVINHGTTNAYDHHKCRCEKCRWAKKASRHSHYLKMKDKGYYQQLREERDAPKVSIEPIRALLMDRGRAIQRVSEHKCEGMLHRLGQQYADRFGVSLNMATRLLGRIVRREQANISLENADRWCIVLGYTLSTVYPELYE